MAAAIPLAVAVVTKAPLLTFVGAALSAVGAITGNKGLAKIGGLIGLASMAYGAFGGGAEGLAGGAEAAGGGAGGVGDVAAGMAEEAAALGNSDFLGQSSAQAAIQGGDLASNALDQAGSVSQIAGETAGVQAPAQMAPAQTNLGAGAPSSSASGILREELASLTGSGVSVGGPMGTGATAGGGVLRSVLDWGKENQLLAATGLKMGGEFLAKGFGRDPAAERVDLEKRALDLKEGDLARYNAARAYVPGSIGMAPNPNANLYPEGYRPPLPSLILRTV